MGRKNKKNKKNRNKSDKLDALAARFEGVHETANFLRDSSCSLFTTATAKVEVSDEEIEKLFGAGGAGAQTLEFLKGFQTAGRGFNTFEEVIMAVVQCRVQSWNGDSNRKKEEEQQAPAATRQRSQQLVPQRPAQPPNNAQATRPPNSMTRTKGPPGTDQVVQFLAAAHCNLFSPPYKSGDPDLLQDSIRLVKESGAGVMTVIQIQELNTEKRTFKDVEGLLKALKEKNAAGKKKTNGKVGWEDLKEQYEGVDLILAFLTSSNMFLAETVITMDLMRQMMESVPDNNHETILKYLNMFTEVSTKFASFSMLIDNLRRCARNDKSLQASTVSEEPDAKEAKKKRKKKKREAKRLEKRKMAVLEYEAKKKNGTLTDADVDPRIKFGEEDERRAIRRAKTESVDEAEEDNPPSEMEQMERRKFKQMERKAALKAGGGMINSSVKMPPSIKRTLTGSSNNDGKSNAGRDPRGGTLGMKQPTGNYDGYSKKKSTEEGMLPSINKGSIFPSL